MAVLAQRCCFLLHFQVKYRGHVQRELCSSLYRLLPETAESQRVRQLTELLSEVREGGGRVEGGREGSGGRGQAKAAPARLKQLAAHSGPPGLVVPETPFRAGLSEKLPGSAPPVTFRTFCSSEQV